MSNSLLEKNAKLQEESALLISQLDDYKIQYDNLRTKYNKLYHDYKNVVNQNILQINLDNSSYIYFFNY